MKAVRRTDERMHTQELGVCAQQRTSPRRLCSAARPFSAARALRAHQECGQRARAGVLRPGSSAEHTAQGCGAPRAHGQQTAPAGQRTYRGPGAARQCARARAPRRRRRRVGRPLAAPAPLQVRARSGRGKAPSRAHARGRAGARGTLESAAAREERRSEQGKSHASVTRACSVRRAVKGRWQRRLGSGVDRARQWCRPRTARGAEKV
jgi:hypothetical protein